MCACACLASYCGTLPADDCACMHLLTHLCATLGKKARLHLNTLTNQRQNPSLSIRCLSQGTLEFNGHPSKSSCAASKKTRCLVQNKFPSVPFSAPIQIMRTTSLKSHRWCSPKVSSQWGSGESCSVIWLLCHPPEIPVSGGWKSDPVLKSLQSTAVYY